MDQHDGYRLGRYGADGSYRRASGFLVEVSLPKACGTRYVELGRFRYKKRTLEHYVGNAGRKRLGRKKWQRHVEEVLGRLIAALKPGDVVIGGGNAKKLKSLPPGARAGANTNAFLGGFRLWEGETGKPRSFAPGGDNVPNTKLAIR